MLRMIFPPFFSLSYLQLWIFVYPFLKQPCLFREKIMSMFATLEEAIDAAREEFLADNPGMDEEDAVVQQLNIQKYVLQDGEIMWQVEFFATDEEQGECLPVLSGEAAQSVFDGDYDEIELRQEWLEENTLHEWDEGEFQLEPPLDTEEGRTAADEWDER
jgi:acidic protein MsyB